MLGLFLNNVTNNPQNLILFPRINIYDSNYGSITPYRDQEITVALEIYSNGRVP
jgi:hypothetical protein